MPHIDRDFYTLHTDVDGQNAEITMYGTIVETVPRDYWTGEPKPGEYITADQFLEDINRLSGCKTITIRMNSCGGDAVVSIMIHNRLRELSRGGAHLTCIVDGMAMSGGSIIMCACDEVQVNPSSLIMIHKCWSFVFGAYNADELRDMARANDAYDQAQVAAYVRKTGMSEDELLQMMSEETYMTGAEAVEHGFADSLLDDAEATPIAASADRRIIFVSGGRSIHLPQGISAPENIPEVTPEVDATPAPAATNIPEEGSGTEGGHVIMTLEELMTAEPELVEQIRASGNEAAVNAERQRIADIDQIAGLYSAEMVNEAKYGQTPCTAQELAYRAAQQAAQAGSAFLTNLEIDAGEGGAQSVGAVTPPDANAHPKTESEKMSDARAKLKALKGE